MLNTRGNIQVRTIDGRNGAFNVGTLTTCLGEFRIKDACIEEFDPERYTGEFTIERVYPASYFAGSRLIVEIHAKLASMVLDGVANMPVETDQESDPADEPEPAPAPGAAPEPEPETLTPEPDSGPEPTELSFLAASLKDLFGEQYSLQQVVKFDPTVDRRRFRAQRDELKKLGYKFNFEHQLWKAQAAA